MGTDNNNKSTVKYYLKVLLITKDVAKLVQENGQFNNTIIFIYQWFKLTVIFFKFFLLIFVFARRLFEFLFIFFNSATLQNETVLTQISQNHLKIICVSCVCAAAQH